MKKQLNARISIATREKLNSLKAIYGTQAEALAVAIEHLWAHHEHASVLTPAESLTSARAVASHIGTADAMAYLDDLRPDLLDEK